MTTEPVTIVSRPDVVSPADRIGVALDVPLSRIPDSEWMRVFMEVLRMDQLGVPRLELDNDRLRLWMTSGARRQLVEVLEAVSRSMDAANEHASAIADANEKTHRAATERAETEREALDRDLETWWSSRISGAR
jgi:hypothetical protein